MYTSFLVGRFFSTSTLSLRSINGLNRRWICLITYSWESGLFYWDSSTVKRLVKSSAVSKSLGIKKFSKDQSSFKLFCKGVPVKRILLLVLKLLRSFARTESLFLILCASSKIKYSNSIRPSSDFSIMQVSKVVSNTSKLRSLSYFRIFSLSGPEP